MIQLATLTNDLNFSDIVVFCYCRTRFFVAKI